MHLTLVVKGVYFNLNAYDGCCRAMRIIPGIIMVNWPSDVVRVC